MPNKYTKNDIKVLAEIYKNEIGSSTWSIDDHDEYKRRLNALKNIDYDITKINDVVKLKTPRGYVNAITSEFTHIEQEYIYGVPYEDLPLSINNEYVKVFNPLSLILKWRFQIGK